MYEVAKMKLIMVNILVFLLLFPLGRETRTCENKSETC